MKTQKIKVEIEAEVPVGKYCIIQEQGHCKLLKYKHLYGNAQKHFCKAFPNDLLRKTKNNKLLKCQACLDACKGNK